MSLLYTIVPPEVVWADGKSPTLTLWRHRGRLVSISEGEDGTLLVAGLLSTDPQDFLDPEFTPGSPFKPIEGSRKET